ncbi:MAG: alpha-D-ribose 1-methylphosphonate 5-triphosphate diphosphatase [Pseudomonadota bacterium]
MTEQIITNAKVILADEVIKGTLHVEDSIIKSVDGGISSIAGAIDLEGAYLAPGLVELHTDNLERHMQPRPSVKWPLQAAVMAHDAELAGVGITTVFDAMRVGSIPGDQRAKYDKYARPVVDHILKLRSQGALRISHFLHLRAEICTQTLPEELDEFTEADRIGIVSLMDHTPGQRQFRDLKKLDEYLAGKHGMERAALDAHYQNLYRLQREFGEAHQKAAVAGGRRLGAVLASHDDTTVDEVAKSTEIGVSLAEFPTTLEAARASHKAGLAVIMGAPNLLRGGSHSGNVAASELVHHGLLDILSSDYAPASLLMGAVRNGLESGRMEEGLRLVTKNPAEAVGLKDRGAIEIGRRADFVVFDLVEDLPSVKQTWVQGRRAA